MSYYVSDEYTELGGKVLGEHKNLEWILERGLSVGFMASDKEKRSGGRRVHGECVKVPELYRALLPYDFIIIFYDTNNVDMTDKQMEILMYHELLHIGLSSKEENAKPVIVPHDLEDFKAIVNTYGADWAKTE